MLEPLPLLFLDVDGVVLPIGAELEDLGTALGRQLAALHCELVWATAWQHDANEEIAPRIGLPRLPVVEWRDTTVAEDDEDTYLGLHWKTRLLVEWAAGRDFAWVDDEVADTDANWIAEHHQGRAMVHRVRSPGGLSPADFAVVGRWLRGVRGGVGGVGGS